MRVTCLFSWDENLLLDLDRLCLFSWDEISIVRMVARASDLDRLFVRCIAEGTGGWWMVGGMGFIKKVIIFRSEKVS